MISIFAAYPEDNESREKKGVDSEAPIDHIKSSIKDVHIFNYKDLESFSSKADQPGTEG